MKQLLCLAALACVTLPVTAGEDYNMFVDSDGDFYSAACRHGIFISEIKSLPSLYSVEANIAYITMEESMGDATGESDLDNADLATYIGGYQRFQAAIIRGHFQRVSGGMDPSTLEKAQLLRDEMIDFVEDLSSDGEPNIENYIYELAMLVRKMQLDIEVPKLNSTDQERVNNVFQEIMSVSHELEICLLSEVDRHTLLSLIDTLKTIFFERTHPKLDCLGRHNVSGRLGGVVGDILGPIWRSHGDKRGRRLPYP